ncbi:GNAT family N-acetyltransferase [Patescibacteria group bacterium]|nr:GNAT family N-acetyltransferase [Patescibacteria group bacterium]
MKIIEEKNPSSALAHDITRLVSQLSDSASALTESGLAEIVNSPHTVLFTAQENNIVYGMLILLVYRTAVGRHAYIENIVVDQLARGKGIGSQLVSAAIKRARKEGARHIDLTSAPHREAANHLYLKLGFEKRTTNVYRYQVKQ